MLLRLKLSVLSLMLGIFLVGVCRAQGAGSAYFYPSLEPDPGYRSDYQWRPADSQQSSDDGELQSYRGGAELLTGKHKLKWDQSPGTYRPMKDPQNHILHVGGYRFRSISPAEQARPGSLKEEVGKGGTSSDSMPAELRFRGDESRQNLWPPNTNYQPKFRPDDQFSGAVPVPTKHYQQPKPPAYSIPIYSAPVFREGALDR